MTTIPQLAFSSNPSRNLDKAVFFLIASIFPSPLIPEIKAHAATALIPAFPARLASLKLVRSGTDTLAPAIPANTLFLGSPLIPAGADIPAFPAKPATAAVPATAEVIGVPASPAKSGTAAAICAMCDYGSTDTLSKFTVLLPLNLMYQAMYGKAAILPYNVNTGNVNYQKKDGSTLPAIADVTNLEELVYYYANTDSNCVIQKVVVNGTAFLKIQKGAAFTSDIPTDAGF
jgi:hypothetical protein